MFILRVPAHVQRSHLVTLSQCLRTSVNRTPACVCGVPEVQIPDSWASRPARAQAGCSFGVWLSGCKRRTGPDRGASCCAHVYLSSRPNLSVTNPSVNLRERQPDRGSSACSPQGGYGVVGDGCWGFDAPFEPLDTRLCGSFPSTSWILTPGGICHFYVIFP